MLIYNEECYVAFIDILGFKDYVKSTDPQQILKMFQHLIKVETQIEKDKIRFFYDPKKQEKYNNLSDATYTYIMSDSIIIAIPSKIEDSFKFISKWCKNIQVALLNRFGLLSRGGISKGLYYGDGIVNFGKGMVSAVELEGEAVNPRIIIDPKLIELAKELENFLAYKFDVLVACDEKDGQYYIDYLDDFNWDAQTRDTLLTLIERGKNTGYDGVKSKYEWLETHIRLKIDEYEEMIYQDRCAQEYFESEEYQTEDLT